ncbi:MAG: nucleoside deaminase [Rhodospirillaceae bacterium]|nr:nucleoside deaminase [Rhodospirillaceae bacterium]MBT4589596.1 nucleoside deaminase [Rhodospirillaceae bacterium]MBT7266868.1 nucleoside deaminase [Rhodospirillaceae bacterium]
MELAIEQAQLAGGRGEVPVGAVIVDHATGTVVAKAGNRTEEQHDPTAHAEMLVIQAATKAAGSPRLENCDLYVTLEPCPMCATAISFARIGRLYFGAFDPKSGGVDHGPRIYNQPTCHHAPEIYGGIEESRAGDLLKDFFAQKR